MHSEAKKPNAEERQDASDSHVTFLAFLLTFRGHQILIKPHRTCMQQLEYVNPPVCLSRMNWAMLLDSSQGSHTSCVAGSVPG